MESREPGFFRGSFGFARWNEAKRWGGRSSGWRGRFVFLGGGGGSWKIGIGQEGNVFFFRKKS